MINKVHCTDCIEFMKQIPDNSVDAIVTDPPAGISFMQKSWDTFDKNMFGKKGEEGENDLKVKKNFEILPRYGNADMLGFQDFICVAFTEAIRCLKPGGHALVWAIPRTSHHTAMGLERAGFEIRDICTHIFGSGFPKSYNIAKGIDALKRVGKTHPKGINQSELSKNTGQEVIRIQPNCGILGEKRNVLKRENAELVTPEAKGWDGWGTALKPASEHWILCRKPISEKTIAENVLKWGVGGLAIDDCRIPSGTEHFRGYVGSRKTENDWKSKSGLQGNFNATDSPKGRFPSNFILTCNCEEIIEQGEAKPPYKYKDKNYAEKGFMPNVNAQAPYNYNDKGRQIIHTNPLCPCYILDHQSGKLKSGKMKQNINGGNFNVYGHQYPRNVETIGDMGGASRFFYVAKASKSERDMGCDNLPLKEIYPQNNSIERKELNSTKNERVRNNHPTVKPLAFMKYLVKLISREGQIVLDPFAGSGSTLIACRDLGRKFIGIEKEADYVRIAEARLKKKQEELF